MPNFDKPNTATLFDGGIVIPTVNISLIARQKYPWAGNIPIEIYFDYVLPYASVNEARTNWRQLLWNKLSPQIDELLYNYKTNQNDALRTFGVPARLVGTPAWNGNV